MINIIIITITTIRLGRNPQTGEQMQIGASKSITFSVSTNLKIKESPPQQKTEAVPKKKTKKETSK